MKFTSFKNTSISFTDEGQGKTVVLLHGFLENKKMWKNYNTIFSKNYRIITIDLLGHGNSDCLGYIHTMENNAEMVHQVLSELNIPSSTIIGHSMGGYVALAFAELYPEKTTGIVLLNSTSKEDSEERKTNRLRAIKAVKQNFKTFASMAVANLFSEQNRTRFISEIENIKQEALKTPLQGVIASLEGMRIRKDRTFILQEATFPILLILGKSDPVLNYDETMALAKETTIQTHTFPDGHMSSVENEAELILVLESFLKTI